EHFGRRNDALAAPAMYANLKQQRSLPIPDLGWAAPQPRSNVLSAPFAKLPRRAGRYLDLAQRQCRCKIIKKKSVERHLIRCDIFKQNRTAQRLPDGIGRSRPVQTIFA
ncbi:MAG: hypothetical protein KAR37_01790, partial [Alphaproteobacteria bacterium]|nr:hypothetical protein [Alphaproteobacteria bacterium]